MKRISDGLAEVIAFQLISFYARNKPTPVDPPDMVDNPLAVFSEALITGETPLTVIFPHRPL